MALFFDTYRTPSRSPVAGDEAVPSPLVSPLSDVKIIGRLAVPLARILPVSLLIRDRPDHITWPLNLSRTPGSDQR